MPALKPACNAGIKPLVRRIGHLADNFNDDFLTYRVLLFRSTQTL